jgi:hypothetical protein
LQGDFVAISNDNSLEIRTETGHKLLKIDNAEIYLDGKQVSLAELKGKVLTDYLATITYSDESHKVVELTKKQEPKVPKPEQPKKAEPRPPANQ